MHKFNILPAVTEFYMYFALRQVFKLYMYVSSCFKGLDEHWGFSRHTVQMKTDAYGMVEFQGGPQTDKAQVNETGPSYFLESANESLTKYQDGSCGDCVRLK